MIASGNATHTTGIVGELLFFFTCYTYTHTLGPHQQLSHRIQTLERKEVNSLLHVSGYAPPITSLLCIYYLILLLQEVWLQVTIGDRDELLVLRLVPTKKCNSNNNIRK